MRRYGWLVTPALISVLTMSMAATSVTAQAPGEPPRRLKAAANHPHIQNALRQLHGAARQLDEAAHHYDGHRAKALELVRQAVKELDEAIGWANAHPDEFKK